MLPARESATTMSDEDAADKAESPGGDPERTEQVSAAEIEKLVKSSIDDEDTATADPEAIERAVLEEGRVELREFAVQQAHRPAVRGDMVQHQHQEVVVGSQLNQGRAEHPIVGEIEGTP